VTDAKRLFLAWLLPFALGLPFVGRAVFVDDHYHRLMARGLLEHPARPYDFRADDAGPDNLAWERGSFPRMVNPPLHHYLLAAFEGLGGGRLWVTRLGALAFSSLAAVFLFLLARRWLFPPWPVTALAVLTPAFWLSSYSLLIDSTMLTFFLASLWAWVEGLRKGSAPLLAAAGLMMGCTVLTKYTGGFVCVLAVVWWAMQEKRRPRDLLWLLVPAAVLLAWNAWTAAVYGAPHLLASSERVVQTFQWSNVLVFLIFFSGVLLAPLAGWAQAGRGPRLAAGLSAALLAGFLSSAKGGYDVLQAVQMAAFAFGGVLFLLEALRRAGSSPERRFLAVWLLLGSLQMVFVMGWFAARYYLVVLPPAILLFYAWLQDAGRSFPSRLNRRQSLAAAAFFAAGLALAWADHRQAGVHRLVRADVVRDGWEAAGGRRFYLGDSFTGSVLKDAGWETAFPETEFKPGDLVLARQVVMPAWWFRLVRLESAHGPDGPGLFARTDGPGQFEIVKVYEYPWAFPLRVMDNDGAAGFYASVWGALPFAASKSPLDRYVLLKVTN
jgi:hypothetical protein